MKKNLHNNDSAPFLSWTDEMVKLVLAGETVSVDFWNTLVIETSPRRNVRLMVCARLINEFDLKMNSENLYEYFTRVSNGLISLSRESGRDEEYKLLSAWYYIGINFFKSEELARFFATRSVEIEVDISFLNSIVLDKTQKDFNSIVQSENLLVISDFEGDSNFLRQIAERHGLELPNIVLVSSEHLLNKRSSRLFKLHPHLGADSYHFGDNHSADIKGAELAGITAIQVPHAPQETTHNRKKPVFPRPATSFNNDKKAASMMVSHFIHELTCFVRKGDKVFFLGSEGAFLSNSIIESQEDISFACFNGGRKFVMLACLESETTWMLSRYIQESVKLRVLYETLGVEIENQLATERAFWCIANGDPSVIELLSDDQISKSQAARLKLAKDFEVGVQNSRLVLIDIGYRGTFAQSVKRLFDCQVSVIQIFGKNHELEQNGIETLSLFREDGGFDFRSSIPMIELIFGAGPRASFSGKLLSDFQNELWNSRETPKEVNIRRDLARFLHWPSKRLINLIKDSIAHDDFSSENTLFVNNNLSIKERFAITQLAHYHFGNFGVACVYLTKKIRFEFSK